MSQTHVATSPDVDPNADLTLFQQNMLLVLAQHEDFRDYGLAIKRDLEELYGQDINHGRLYPNLDDLVEKGLIVKGELDRRTNYYELSLAGRELLEEDAQRRARIVNRFKDDL